MYNANYANDANMNEQHKYYLNRKNVKKEPKSLMKFIYNYIMSYFQGLYFINVDFLSLVSKAYSASQNSIRSKLLDFMR